MKKRSFMFTNKSYSDLSILSTVLGLITLLSQSYALYLSFQVQGAIHSGIGVAELLAFLFAIAGEAVGVSARLERDRFYLFANLGIALNAIGILMAAVFFYAGIVLG